MLGPRLRRATALVALALGLAGCGDCGCGTDTYGDDHLRAVGVPVVSESEPNATTATAKHMALNQAGQGSVGVAGDVDCWSFDATAAEIVRIDLQAVRLDQTAWDTACNVPRLTLIDRDGVTRLLEHDFSGVFSAGWQHGRHDLDVPAFRIPVSGRYFVCVTQDNQAAAGGRYTLWVRSAGVSISATEVEAVGATGVNETPATAQALGDPGTGTRTLLGWYVDGESDVYSFAVAAPSLVTFETIGTRVGVQRADDDYLDPVLNLIASNGVTLLDANDDAFFGDASISYAITTPGTYFVQVSESAGSAGDGAYYLTYRRTAIGGALESEPNDTSAQADPIDVGDVLSGNAALADVDFLRFSGTAGDVIRVHVYERENRQDAVADVDVQVLLADGVTPLPSASSLGAGELHVVRTVLQANGVHFLRVAGLGAATNWTVRLERVRTSRRESEPNGTQATASPLDASGHAAGVIDPAGDADWFKFSATANELVTVTLLASRMVAPGSDGHRFHSGHGSTLRPGLTAFDPTGAFLGEVTFTPPVGLCSTAEGVADGLPTVTLTFVAPTAGTYAVEVIDEAGVGGPTATYALERR